MKFKDIVFMLVFVSVTLNMATGIVMAMFGISQESPMLMGNVYDTNEAEQFSTDMNGSINPTSQLEDSSDAFDRLLDSIGLGIINKIRGWLNNYLFGFWQLMETLFGSHMNTATRTLIFGGIHVFTILAYTMTLVWFFTGKEVLE